MATVFLSGLCGACSVVSLGMVHWTRYIKLFSAGVIASLALVHITNEVITELAKYTEFPVGGTCILVGILFMSITEHVSHSWTGTTTLVSEDSHDDVQGKDYSTSVDIEAPLNTEICCSHEECSNEVVKVEENDDYHVHSCITNLNSKSLASAAIKYQHKHTKLFAVYIFEFACVFHSLLIGVSVGMTTNTSTLKTLTIALCFHQFLEGVSLGCVISEARLSVLKRVLMVVSYSVTTPIGIALSLGLQHIFSYGEIQGPQRTQALVQGCMQGFSAGMLIYIALIQIIAEEFSKEDLHGRGKWLSKLGMYAALLTGATSMCGLALWL